MSTASAIGRNIKNVRTERGMTQRDVYEATGISASQLSSYENGKQMIGLPTLAKIAVALNTSIDRLYFGAPSEAFLNESEDFGETVVNCFKKLRELGVVRSVSHSMTGGSASASIEKCGYELAACFPRLENLAITKITTPTKTPFLSNSINQFRTK